MTSKVSRAVPRVRLPADFAKQVIGRVERIEHRQSIRRRALGATSLLGISLVALFTWRYPLISSPRASIAELSPPSTALANLSPRDAEPVGLGQEEPVVDPLLPDGYMVTNFVNSSGESGWHSYDSWWGPSS